jgi:hypothetical protein
MQPLPDLLTALTQELVQIRDGGEGALSAGNGRLDKSADDDFIYVEADIACQSTTEIDISIHQTRAFVRIERRSEDLESIDQVRANPNSIFGWVEFSQEGATIRANLTTSGVWSCAVAPETADMLNKEFSPDGDLEDHASVCDVLIKAAERLGGLAWLDPDRLLDD